jgi:hypothetical protein
MGDTSQKMEQPSWKHKALTVSWCQILPYKALSKYTVKFLAVQYR